MADREERRTYYVDDDGGKRRIHIIDEKEDLGIHSDTSLREYAERVAGLILLPLGYPGCQQASRVVFPLLAVVIIGSRVFRLADSLWQTLLVLLALMLFVLLWGAFRRSYVDKWVVRLFFGGPIFGELGGEPRTIFFSRMKAANAIEVEIDDEDVALARDFQRFHAKLIEERLKLKYREEYKRKYERVDEADFRARWAALWNDKILQLRTGNLRFKDMLAETNLGYPLAGWLPSTVVASFDWLMSTYVLLMLFLTTMLLRNQIGLLLTVQVAVFSGFIFSLVWFLWFSVGGGALILDLKPEELPESLVQKYSSEFARFLGETIHPKALVATARFYNVMRGQQLRQLLTNGLLLSGLVLSGLLLLLGTLSDVTELTVWYRRLTLALVLIPLFFFFVFTYSPLLCRIAGRCYPPWSRLYSRRRCLTE